MLYFCELKFKSKLVKNNDNINWFEDWFNSPYYHLLYSNRNQVEADYFISNLINYLKPNQSSKLIDIACGKGRHALTMNKLGYAVDAFDLSMNSIREAKKYESPTLKFYVNDIRKSLKKNHYQYAFNLFTSFGYFEEESDNLQAIKAISDSLTKDGFLIIDFLNVLKNNLMQHEEQIKTIGVITFFITKEIKNQFILKHIKFCDDNIEYNFTEKVKLIDLGNFKNYLTYGKLKIEAIFGDYSLNPFDEKNSDRLIIIAKK